MGGRSKRGAAPARTAPAAAQAPAPTEAEAAAEAKAKEEAATAATEAKAREEAATAAAAFVAQVEAAKAAAEAEAEALAAKRGGPFAVLADARVIEVRASRPTFRRAGLAFGSTEWTAVNLADLTTGQVLALLEEPVLTIRAVDADGKATALPADIRTGLIEVLKDQLADD